MDLTFQVPMQYCSLLLQTLLSPSDTSTIGCCFCLGSASPHSSQGLSLTWPPTSAWPGFLPTAAPKAGRMQVVVTPTGWQAFPSQPTGPKPQARVSSECSVEGRRPGVRAPQRLVPPPLGTTPHSEGKAPPHCTCCPCLTQSSPRVGAWVTLSEGNPATKKPSRPW